MNKEFASRPGAVLWDMDGVLVDTADLHYQTWKSALASRKIPFSRSDFNQTFGMNNEQTLTYLIGEPPHRTLLDELSDKKEEQFRKLVRESGHLYSGAMELLSSLHQAGYIQAVASSAPMENIETVLEIFNLEHFFQVFTSGHNLPSKPDPGLFLLAARKLQVPAQECVVIEDAFAGIQAANRAGMKCIAVATTNPIEALEEADHAVTSLEELRLEDFQRLLQSNKGL